MTRDEKRAYMKIYNRKYRKTESGIAARKRITDSLVRKEYMRQYLIKYRATHKAVAYKAQRSWQKQNPEVRIFCGMKQRCNNPKNKRFSYYGGRGIECRLRTWRDIISAIGPRPSTDYSIDRINNDGHYEIGNIRWATRKQQQANTRRYATNH